MAAAMVAGAVPTISDRAARAADSSADDAVGVAAAVSVLPIEGGTTQVPFGDNDELIPGRQHIGIADVWEANVSHPHRAEGAAIIVSHRVIFEVIAAVMMDDVHCGVVQGDLDDLEGAVAVEKQPRGTVACVAGEVEPRPVAVGGPKAEGVRHAHVAAASAAVGR